MAKRNLVAAAMMAGLCGAVAVDMPAAYRDPTAAPWKPFAPGRAKRRKANKEARKSRAKNRRK